MTWGGKSTLADIPPSGLRIQRLREAGRVLMKRDEPQQGSGRLEVGEYSREKKAYIMQATLHSGPIQPA